MGLSTITEKGWSMISGVYLYTLSNLKVAKTSFASGIEREPVPAPTSSTSAPLICNPELVMNSRIFLVCSLLSL
jgi:hypothetical protein